MAKENSFIKLRNVSKFYYSNGVIASGFNKVNLDFKMGEFVAITGESGSGKSTLLNVISGLDSYEEGEMYINGNETSYYTESDFEDYRRKYIGNIFQSFNLVNSYTVYQNIELVLLLNGAKKKDIKNKVYDLIKEVDLWKHRNTKVSKLSGGQKQRVAIARALAKDTPIIIADEPTGNLDSRSATGIIKLLSEIAKDKLVIIVTHNYEQVEPYVTRKIKMHDGKVLEDKVIKEVKEVTDIEMNEYKNIRLFNKIRLAFRNAFNIFTKCSLTLAVYLFLCLAVLFVYTELKMNKEDISLTGFNQFFNNIEPTRIVINKKDKSEITEDDFKALEQIENVKKVDKIDLLLDEPMSIAGGKTSDGYYSEWVYGYVTNISELDESKIVFGRKPENDNEIVIESNDYEFIYETDKYLEKEFVFQDLDNNVKYKVVGIISDKSEMYEGETKIYVPDKVFDSVRFSLNRKFSKITLDYMDKIGVVGNNSEFYAVKPLFNVPRGWASFLEEMSYICGDQSCHGKKIKITSKTPYYEQELTLTTTGVVSKDIWKKSYQLSEQSYNENYGTLFLNIDDYNELFNKGNYQSSIFVTKNKYVDGVVSKLDEMGYKTLAMKDAIVDSGGNQIITIIATLLSVGLIVVSFFISYFVITIIMKSKNIYFGTIRMLGANSKVAKQLLSIELFVLSTTAYALVLLVALGHVFGIYDVTTLNSNFLTNIVQYISPIDFVVMYIITAFMSLAIAGRYSRKLFGLTAVNSIKEEV